MKKLILSLAVLTFAFATATQAGDDKPKAPADSKAAADAKAAAATADAKDTAKAGKAKKDVCDDCCDDTVKPLMSPRAASTR